MHKQGLATRPRGAGKALFGMLSVFADFERSIIRERVLSGMARAKAKGTKSREGNRAARDSSPHVTLSATPTAARVSLRAVARKHNVGVETSDVAWPRSSSAGCDRPRVHQRAY